MRRHRLQVLAVLLGILVCLSSMCIGAVPSAHGQLSGSVTTYFGGIERVYDVRLSFNVQDRGPEEGDDSGAMSGTLFDPETGAMCSVLISSNVVIADVLENGDVYFVAILRLVAGSFPTEQRRIQFWAHDGDIDGSVDAFKIGPFPVTIYRGRITAAFPH